MMLPGRPWNYTYQTSHIGPILRWCPGYDYTNFIKNKYAALLQGISRPIQRFGKAININDHLHMY